MSTRKKNTTMIRSLLSGTLGKRGRKVLSREESITQEMHKQWNAGGEVLSVHPAAKEKIWKQINFRLEKSHRLTKPPRFWRNVAATILVLLLLTGGGFRIHHSLTDRQENQFIEITADENRTCTLPDSSQVWMYPGSSIRFPRNFTADRAIRLKGNAFFEVLNRENAPFRVHIEKAFIEVKGTCFYIRQTDSTANEITLYNGDIEFTAEAKGEKIKLSPMQTLIYNPTNSAIQLKTIKNIEWKNGCYKFTNISLQQLILKINEIYTPDIYLNKDIDGSCEFTGSICHHETQDKVIEKICYSLNLQKKNINGKILLYNLH